jgi:hypothetical protein
MFILFFVFLLEIFSPQKTRLFSFDSDFAEAISKPRNGVIDEVEMEVEMEVKGFEEETKIQFPGFFEVFPELRMKWPKWSRDKRGNAIPCASDTDCPFPQTCCDHPIIPRERKYCCTGWGQRQLIPAYVRQEIQGF